MNMIYRRSWQFLLLFLMGIFLGFILPKPPVVEPNLSNNINNIIQESSIIPAEFNGKLSLFILAGQSNMSGRGELLKNQAINPRIFVFGNDYEWHLAREPVDNPKGQVDRVSQDLHAGFSPSLAFANGLLRKNPEQIIGLIPCAKGGSSIAEWQRNLAATSLYGSCLKRVKIAQEKGKVRGLLFFQGEADALLAKPNAKYPPFPGLWRSKFITFIDNFRSDIEVEDLPVVYAQIGTNKSPNLYVNWWEVKQQQASIKLPNVAMIYTEDLSLKDDVHFTTAGYEVIGERFAESFWLLTEKSPP